MPRRSLFDRMIERLKALRSRTSSRAEIETLRLLAATCQDVIYRKQLWPTRRFDYVSPGFTKLTGYTPEECYRDPGLDILARSADRDQILQRIVDGSTEPLELALVRKDGAVIWIEKTSMPIYDAKHRLVGVHGIMRDITHRRRAETAQRLLAGLGNALTSTLELESMLQLAAELAVEHLADISVIELVEGMHVRRRAAAHRDAEVLELVRNMRIAPDRRQLLWRVVDRRASLLVSSFADGELEAVSPGVPLAVLRAVRLTSYIGVPLWARGVVFGVLHLGSTTEHHHYDAEDLALGEEIGRKISMAIENAHLYAAARRGIQARDEILGVVAHDLRNPLAAIRLSAESLQLAPSDPLGTRKSLMAITRSVDRADGLIRDLLDVTRIEAGGLELERVSIGPALVLAEVAEAMTPIATAASVEIHQIFDEDLPPIEVDPRRMSQVFSNLLGNAIKFIGPSGGVVELRARPDNDSVHFEVRDTGPGIADRDIPRLFDRFWQARRNDRRGAGLGLPITKGIIDAHGGQIWVVSQVGRGTTFHITIPAASHRPSEAATLAQPMTSTA